LGGPFTFRNPPTQPRHGKRTMHLWGSPVPPAPKSCSCNRQRQRPRSTETSPTGNRVSLPAPSPPTLLRQPSSPSAAHGCMSPMTGRTCIWRRRSTTPHPGRTKDGAWSGGGSGIPCRFACGCPRDQCNWVFTMIPRTRGTSSGKAPEVQGGVRHNHPRVGQSRLRHQRQKRRQGLLDGGGSSLGRAGSEVSAADGFLLPLCSANELEWAPAE